MPNIIIEDRGKVAVLRLANGVTNAINRKLTDELSDALRQVSKRYRGMVLAGGSKFFSIGFELPSLLKLSRKEMADFYCQFERTALELFSLPIPTVAALSGHAIAGGCILAIACDFRLAASGRRYIGLNEIKIGVPVPYLADLILRQIVGDRVATTLVYQGAFLEPDKAEKLGIIDGIYSPESLEEEALKKIALFSDLPEHAFSIIKENRVEAVCRRYEENHRSKNDLFLNCWFNPAVQKLLHDALEKF